MSSPNPNPNPSRPSRRCVSSPAARRRSSSCRHHLPCSYHVVTTCLPCAYHVLTMYLPCRSCSSGTTTHYVLTMYLPRAYYALTMHSPRRCVRVAGLCAQQPRDAPLRRARRGDAHPCLQPVGTLACNLRHATCNPTHRACNPIHPACHPMCSACNPIHTTCNPMCPACNPMCPGQAHGLLRLRCRQLVRTQPATSPASQLRPLNRVWCQPATPPYRVRLLLTTIFPHYTPSGTPPPASQLRPLPASYAPFKGMVPASYTPL